MESFSQFYFFSGGTEQQYLHVSDVGLAGGNRRRGSGEEREGMLAEKERSAAAAATIFLVMARIRKSLSSFLSAFDWPKILSISQVLDLFFFFFNSKFPFYF